MRHVDGGVLSVVGNAGERSVLRSVHETLVYNR